MADKLELAIQLPNSSGVMSVDNLSVFVVEKRLFFQILSYSLFALRLVFGFVCAYYYRKQKYFYLLLGGSIVVLFLMMAPLEIKIIIIDWFKALLFTDNRSNTIELAVKYSDMNLHNTVSQVSKPVHDSQSTIKLPYSSLGHFVIFFIYTLFVSIIKNRFNFKLIVFLMIFAMVTETLQLFTIDRQANIVDFSINLTGVFIASVLLFFARMLIHFKQQLAGK